MSKNRNVYARIRTRARTTPDIPWLNMYRDEINKEINLVLDPTSSLLTGYCFIRDTRRLSDIQVVKGLADSFLFPNKWWGYSCYQCSFIHPRYRFEYKKMLEIYPLMNYDTYISL